MIDLLIKNGMAVTPNGTEITDIAVDKGRIVSIGTCNEPAEKTIHADGLHVLPGVIDSQVHFREPGNTHKEDLATGTKSAVLGGVTGVFEMPNTNPATTSVEAFNDKINAAKGRVWCDVAFFVGGTPNEGANWYELEDLPGCSGIKIFMGSSTGDLLVEQDEVIEHILSHSRRRIAVHCEDEPRLRERFHLAQEGAHARFHPVWRDEETAFKATSRLLAIARKTNHPVHVLHVTTKQEMELLAKNKDVCSVEVLPQHLTLTDEAYETLGNYAQMNPPIRSKDHQEALWKAVNTGVVDAIGSDHAPHTKEEKDKPYPQSPAGLPGVQTLVPIMLHHVNNGKLSLERFVDLTSAGPQRLFHLKNKGRIAVGYDGDFTIVDMKKENTIRHENMASKCGWTPYDGMKVKGWPTHTIIRGNVVMQDDTVIGSELGQPILFTS